MWNREDFKKWVRAVGCAESYLRAHIWEVLRICCRSSKGAIWHCTVKNLCFVLHQVTFQTQYVTSKKKSERWCMSCLILKKLHSIPFSSILSSAEILDFSLALKIVDPLKKIPSMYHKLRSMYLPAQCSTGTWLCIHPPLTSISTSSLLFSVVFLCGKCPGSIDFLCKLFLVAVCCSVFPRFPFL